ncbi:hypothetical protein HRG_003950 [Hirsutella rhossiliensis]|uniref:Uncharacterized protein n=1 Tax=Hirsutella rhossiliensis TaxID=111463 RepID=A0A9P8N328_9HYPO|nr:uncharacterized protein HRG_03950 [Hirsutella rhossiliensis]KAH0965934.1 hypothetical protein HRG_03950 [Hirsutella rhossiliensis]
MNAAALGPLGQAGDQEKPKWLLVGIQQERLPDPDVNELERHLPVILQAMLQDSGDDAKAIGEAAQRILSYYHELVAESVNRQQREDRGVVGFLNEDPDLEFYDEAIGIPLEQYWNMCQVPLYNGCQIDELRDSCNYVVSVSALFAKFLAAGILTARIRQFAAIQLAESRAPRVEGKAPALERTRRWCWAAAAAHYILLAGNAVAEAVRFPSTQPQIHALGEAEWKASMAQLKHLAETVPEEADRGLKGNAQRAYERMGELLPELARESLAEEPE